MNEEYTNEEVAEVTLEEVPVIHELREVVNDVLTEVKEEKVEKAPKAKKTPKKKDKIVTLQGKEYVVGKVSAEDMAFLRGEYSYKTLAAHGLV